MRYLCKNIIGCKWLREVLEEIGEEMTASQIKLELE